MQCNANMDMGMEWNGNMGMRSSGTTQYRKLRELYSLHAASREYLEYLEYLELRDVP